VKLLSAGTAVCFSLYVQWKLKLKNTSTITIKWCTSASLWVSNSLVFSHIILQLVFISGNSLGSPDTDMYMSWLQPCIDALPCVPQQKKSDHEEIIYWSNKNRTNIWARMWMLFQVNVIQSGIQEVLVELRTRFCPSMHQDSFQGAPWFLQGTTKELSCYKHRFLLSPSFLS